MALAYWILQVLAVTLMAVDCWIPALILSCIALSLGLLAKAWRSARPVKAPRPHPA